jgi:tRNA pseudouridine55 synthase
MQDGVILVDKPAGKTSHDVVYAVRRSLPGKRRVGHAGTLDPFATGLLLVLVGRATKAQRFFMGLPKAYEVKARLGATSTTGDTEGEVEETGRVPGDEVLTGLPTGAITQRPPAYSAVKIDGERAYKKARRGEEVQTAERTVQVERFELLDRTKDEATGHETADFAVECSSGTYVRSLIADLGDAYCLELRRTRIGAFDVAQADPDRIVGLAEALSFLPARELDADTGRRAAHGSAVPGEAPGPVRLVDPSGLVAIAEPREGKSGSELKPVVGFRAS